MTKTLTTLSFLVSITLAAQNPFPSMKGETPNGEKVVLPDDGKGKMTVVGLAYSKKAESALEAWYEPAYLRFVKKHGLFAGTYDANLYFIPMFVGANKAAYGPSMKKIQKSAEPDVLDHIVFFKGELSEYQNSLGLKDKSKPYFFVLNEKGQIVHSASGGYSEDKLEVIEELLME